MRTFLFTLLALSAACADARTDQHTIIEPAQDFESEPLFDQPQSREVTWLVVEPEPGDKSCGEIESTTNLHTLCDGYGGVYTSVEDTSGYLMMCEDGLALLFIPDGQDVGHFTVWGDCLSDYLVSVSLVQ